MGVDKRGVLRGPCTACQECEEFTSNSILCEYCGHTPVQHVNLEPAAKRQKLIEDKESSPGSGDEITETVITIDEAEDAQGSEELAQPSNINDLVRLTHIKKKK